MRVFRGKVRPRLRHLVLLAILALVGWVAAPALSMRPYMPGAVDFEQPLGAVERIERPATARLSRVVQGGEGPVTHVSATVDAPHRFDLAGLAGEERSYELRARKAGGEWSEWIETVDGNPVYFGGADEVQLRTRGWRPTGELHYVNVSGTTSETQTLLNGARRAINGAFISVASAIQPQAEADLVRPDYVSRAEWGAKGPGGCHPRDDPTYGKVKAVVVHHTVTANDYTPEEAPGIVLGICRYHRNANGWNDIGYNALIDRYGTIYMGRAGGLAKAVVGAHAQGFNSQTTGIAAIGTHTKLPISEESMASFADLVAWKLAHHGHPAMGTTKLRSAGGSLNKHRAGKKIRSKRVIGHRKLDFTECPGDSLKLQLRELRHRAQDLIDGTVIKPTKPTEEPPPTGGTGG